jgi:uncharacterized protein YjdB
LCIGLTDTYTSNGDAGGTWSSTNTAVATVNASTGEVTTIAAGTTDIKYTVNAGCNNPASSIKTLTVDPTANAGTVIGQGRLCVGTTAPYTSSGDPGGTWFSFNPAVATIDANTGIVNAISEGFADFKYTVNTGCYSPVSSFLTIAVETSISAGTVSGTTPLCIGATATYTSTGIVGGLWSSTNTAVATVNPLTGLVTAVGGGTSNITYTLIGCGNTPVSAIRTLTVNPNANAGTVSGTSPLCIGATANFTSDGNVAGVWSSTNTAVATVIPATGVVTTIAAGTTDIKYTVTGCNGPAIATKTLTVSPPVTAGTVTGTSPLCIGATASYTSDGDTGGTWSSSNPLIASVNPATGLVSALAVGTSDIVYTVNSGCGSPVSNLKTVTINSCATIVNLKLYLQGYYMGGGLMQHVMLNQGAGASTTQTDNITVELHNTTAPFSMVASTTGMLNTDGNVTLSFAPISGSYYVAVKHRNTIQTWSAIPLAVGPTPTPVYDFSTAANKAFGNNMKQVGSVWVMYTGDLNQDEFIDGFDYPAFDNDNLNGVNGVYVGTDMNGDGFVDGFDYPVFDNNNLNGIQSIHP